MKISAVLNPMNVLYAICWVIIWLILLTSAWVVLGITDESERGVVIGGILMVAEKHLYLAAIAGLITGFGINNNVKAGRSVASSILRWLPIGAALYVAAIGAIILSYT